MPISYFREIPNLTLDQFKRCPFCGEKIMVEREDGIKIEEWDGKFESAWNVICNECDISIGPFVTPSHACLVWNRRTVKEK